MRSRHTRRVHLACAGVAIGFIPMFFDRPAQGADRSWIDPGGGDFGTAGNWSPASIPGSLDAAHFALGGTYTVSFAANRTNQRMRVGIENVTFDLNGRAYTLTAAGAATDPSIGLGQNSFPIPRTSQLTLTDGTLSGVNAVLGRGTVVPLSFAIPGRVFVNAGAGLNLSGALFAGFDTVGSVAVVDGADVNVANGSWLGFNTGAFGGVSVSGAGSTYTEAFLTVGSSGNGTMSVVNDGDLTTTMEAYLGRFPSATGAATISGIGSSWNNTGTAMFVGAVGAGSLTISDGGAVTSPIPRIGDGTGSTGVALVTGNGSRWNATGSGGRIGNFGRGALMINNGGTASFGSVEVGSDASAVGTVIVSGTGSKWTAGIVSVGRAGTGRIDVTAGAFFDSFNFVRLGGGIFTTGSGTGVMTVDGAGSRFDGGLNVEETSTFTVSSGGHANLDYLENYGTVTITGGTGSFGTVTGQFASYGSGRLNVTAGGSFTAQSIKQSVLNITGNGRATVRPDGTDAAVSAVQNLALGGSPGAWQGTLDLTNNDLVIDYDLGSPLLSVADQIRTAYNGGAWNGTGITSSSADASQFALGFAESSSVFTTFPATFSGISVDDTAVLIKFTRYGDANLDGVVNLNDFNALAANFGQSNRFWRQGDFTYDGLVNLNDFNRLAANFGLTAVGPEVTPQDWANLAAAVPEPGVSGSLVGALALLRRRARRNL